MKKTIKDEIKAYVVDFHRKLKDCDVLYNKKSILYKTAKNEVREQFNKNKALMRESIRLFRIKQKTKAKTASKASSKANAKYYQKNRVEQLKKKNTYKKKVKLKKQFPDLLPEIISIIDGIK